MNIFKRHNRKNREKIVYVIDENCARCRVCINKCHHHVLDMVRDQDGLHLVVKDPDRCSGCGDCVKACKFKALELVQRAW
jgi:NAD-dependent dihydropyrimidine dehydrogenase PreA subunit